MPSNTIEASCEVLAEPAEQLLVGARIVIGRYRVEVVTAPEPAPLRVQGDPEVHLVVRDLEDGSVWGITVGAAQRYPLVVTS